MSEKKKMGMEISFKIIITFFGVIVFFFFLKGVWKGQLDVKETFSRLLKSFVSEPDFIAKRNPNMIYQAGKEVGIVSGNVIESGNAITFEELSETEGLNRENPFEYKRYKLKINRIETFAGLKITASSTNSKTRKAVLSNVVCEKLK
ncbi:MAG: hypothetical protein WC476_13075 [Phycisphaerae bacterium]|jgi:hypothetical protein